MVESLTVPLGERSYPIYFGQNLTHALRSGVAGLRAQGRPVALLVDGQVAALQAQTLQAALAELPSLVLPAGEESKSLAAFGQVLEFLAEQRVDRSGVLLVVGGGVIGDLGGFAAAAYLRGIDFWQVPTTLLAMVDSSVGGKTGLNLRAGKNLVGAFHQPRAVYVATDWLQTLPPREFAAGLAEVIKYGLLGDAALLARLESTPLTPASPDLAAVVRRCCEIKAAVVAADERELASTGGRALLNLGHTFGHAIEQVTGYGGYLHGEAIAIGLSAAARLSQRLGYLEPAAVQRVDRVLAAHALPTRLRTPLAWADLAAAMARDKKVRAGRLRFVVLRALGQAVTQGEIDPSLAEASFRDVGAV